ncbi:MAG: hypothetical protein AAGF26_07815 [Cyanobacteria bacterium P01_G01_bin.49]
MPNKRSRRGKTPQVHCPQCGRRLWRIGGPKYYLFYEGASDIQHGFKLSHKKAKFLATQNPVCVNQNVWLEEFFCEEHGHIWIHMCRSDEGKISSRPAKREDWKRTSQTINPDRPTCSVSDFTYRMSRRASPHLCQSF